MNLIMSSSPGGEGRYSHILPVGYTGMCRWRGYGFQAIWSGIGCSNEIIENLSSIGFRLTGSLTKD